jgi:hypothetical protein
MYNTLGSSTWLNINNGLNFDLSGGNINKNMCIHVDRGGRIIAGGKFTHSTNSNIRNIAQLYGSTWVAIGNGITDEVINLIKPGNHAVYYAISYSSNTMYINYYSDDTFSWSVIGTITNITDRVTYLETDSDSNLYLSGSFFGITPPSGSSVTAWYLAKWIRSSQTWIPLTSSGSPFNTKPIIQIRPNDNIIFASTNLTSGNQIWTNPNNGSTSWTSYSNINNNNGLSTMLFNMNNTLFVGGSFTSIGGLNINYFAQNTPGTNFYNQGSFNGNSVTTIKSSLVNNIMSPNVLLTLKISNPTDYINSNYAYEYLTQYSITQGNQVNGNTFLQNTWNNTFGNISFSGYTSASNLYNKTEIHNLFNQLIASNSLTKPSSWTF